MQPAAWLSLGRAWALPLRSYRWIARLLPIRPPTTECHMSKDKIAEIQLVRDSTQPFLKVTVPQGTKLSDTLRLQPQLSDILGKLKGCLPRMSDRDRKSTRLNSSHLVISYAVFCLKKKK